MDTFNTPNVVGFIAGFMTTIAFLPQAIKVWRSRSAKDLSLGMYVIFISGIVLWTIYGYFFALLPLILWNIVTLILAGFILVMKLRFG